MCIYLPPPHSTTVTLFFFLADLGLPHEGDGGCIHDMVCRKHMTIDLASLRSRDAGTPDFHRIRLAVINH